MPAGNATGIVIGGYNAQCATDTVGSATALMNSYRDVLVGILGALMGYLLGRLSDRYGRVRVIAINGCGLLASELVMVAVALLHDTLSVKWLFASFVLDGLR
jgi:MFS family permease